MEQSTSLSVTVIIPHLKREDLLANCIRALRKQDHPEFQIVIVDNGSNSRLEAYEAEDGISVLRLPENQGFSGAVNHGIRGGDSRYVALLNDDCVPEPDWLSSLVGGLQRHPEASFAGCKMTRPGGANLLDRAGDGLGLRGIPYGIGHLEVDEGQYDRDRGPLGICAGAALYERSLLTELGGFDESFFAYHEDMDLSLRARMRGHRCVYVGSSVVSHVGSATTGSPFNPFTIYYSTRNLIWLQAKNLPLSLLVRLSLHLLLGHGLWFGKMAVKERQWIPWLKGVFVGVAGAFRVRSRGRRERESWVLSGQDMLSLLRDSEEEIRSSVRRKRSPRRPSTSPSPSIGDNQKAPISVPRAESVGDPRR